MYIQYKEEFEMLETNYPMVPVREKMPCMPNDIDVGVYTLPSTSLDAGCEEAIARIISYSQTINTWIWVDWFRIIETMLGDMRAYHATTATGRRPPTSLIYKHGMAHITNAIMRLMDLGFIEYRNRCHGEVCLVELKPTVSLIEFMLRTPGISTRA